MCYRIDAWDVQQILWWSSSVEVIVATVSTIVYQYANTAVTSYSSIYANNSIPAGTFGGPGEYGKVTVAGVALPTDIIGFNAGAYDRLTTFIYGTEFTNPYGTIYTSPTAVWNYQFVTIMSATPDYILSTYQCPPLSSASWPDVIPEGDSEKVYPSGKKTHVFSVCFLRGLAKPDTSG